MRALWFLVPLLVACGSPKPAHAPEGPAPKTEHADHAGHHGPLVHRFDKPEEWAKVFDDPARDAWQKPAHVVTLMQIEAGATVVDLGTGTGYFLPFLSLAVGTKGKVLALDVEPDMIRYVKERTQKEKLGNIEARAIPGDDPQLAEASVDRLLVVDTWHHIPERKAYAAKLAKALKPGGAVFVVDFTLETDKGPPKQHRLKKEQVVEELAAGGLAATVVKSELPDQYVVKGVR